MSNIIPFNYNSNQVRVIIENEEPWWVLKDVADILGIRNHKNIAARLDPDEKGVYLMDTLGGVQQMTIINEPGLYSVILRSDKPEAKAFKRWITHEVLPQIRKTGAYGINQLYIEAAKLIAKTPTSRVEAVINCLEAAGLKIRKEKPKKLSWEEYKASIPGFDQLPDSDKWEYMRQWESAYGG